PRRAVDRGLEAGVAEAMPAALRHLELLAVLDVIADQLAGFLVVDQRAGRHLNEQVGARPSGAVGAAAVLAALGLVGARDTEIGQCGEAGIAYQPDAAAVAAVPAIGTAEGNVFLAAETDRAIPAIAGYYLDGRLINKLHFTRLPLCRANVERIPCAGHKKAPRRGAFSGTRIALLGDDAHVLAVLRTQIGRAP